MDVKSFKWFWGKTDKSVEGRWNPLILHLIDVSCVADAVLRKEPCTSRTRIADILGLEWNEAWPWLRLIIACHDIGKACPGFQCKWEGAEVLIKEAGLVIPFNPNTSVKHGFVSQIVLANFLIEKGWPLELADKIADAIGCHHGQRASPSCLDILGGDRKALGDDHWSNSRKEIFNSLYSLFAPTQTPTKNNLSGPDFMLLAGLTSFSDWIGSNEEWFPFGNLENCEDLESWNKSRSILAETALTTMSWNNRSPLTEEELTFTQVFKYNPRPLQITMAKVVQNLSSPSILLVEAPMGEGKTEAALYAHQEMQRKFKHRGLYIALPTKATGNAMFKRTVDFLNLYEKNLDIQLIHGATFLNDDFQKLRVGTDDEEKVRAAEWFTHKKRALLSEYGVGTVDQALLAILPVKHQFVRLWGLANRVIVFDEIHAYDTYTGTLLLELIRWLLSLNSSIILLSATLPSQFKQRLAQIVGSQNVELEVSYPRISIFKSGECQQEPFIADPERRISIKIIGIGSEDIEVKNKMNGCLEKGGMGLILVNTVQRAQEIYNLYGTGSKIEFGGSVVGKLLSDNTEVFLFHARFPAEEKQKREENVLSLFGKSKTRNGKKILIATQVAEQSLDLDFDYIITDLAPVDLVLQRAGRLWRHKRDYRPADHPVLYIAGLNEDSPPSFEAPLWWNCIYREDILLRSWLVLKEKKVLMLPDDIDLLVKQVYDEQIAIPDNLIKRHEKGLEEGEGCSFAYKNQAIRATIGFPHDFSWDEPQRFLKSDDDDSGLHPSLIAQTRLGRTSITIIPLLEEEKNLLNDVLDLSTCKRLLLRSISISRKNCVLKLQSMGIPEHWKKSSLLRNSYPFVIDHKKIWVEDSLVSLDSELGLIYYSKEGK